MSRLLEIRDYATAVRTFEWKASWRTSRMLKNPTFDSRVG